MSADSYIRQWSAAPDADFAAECLRAWAEALGHRDRRRTDALWHSAGTAARQQLWFAARAQALAERAVGAKGATTP